MYTCKIKIGFIGDNKEIFEWIEGIEAPEKFKTEYVYLEEADAAAISELGIIVADITNRSADIIDVIQNYRKQRSYLVIIMHGEQKLELVRKKINNVYFIDRLERECILFDFNKVLENLKLRCDHWLTKQYLDTLINSVPHLVWFKDKMGAHLKVNDSFCKAVNKTHEQIQGRGHYYIWDLTPEDYLQGEYICMESEYEVMGKKKTCVFDEKVLIGNEMRQLETYKSPLFDLNNSVMGTVGIAVDVTKEKEYERQLILSATTDTLSGLYNRRYVYQYIDEHSNSPVTIYYIDLDNFKTINDSYGHKEGDRAIVLTAETLKNMDENAVVARLGGDEFLILSLTYDSDDDMEEKRLHIENKLREVYDAEEHFCKIGASVGVAHSNDKEVNLDRLINQADAIMYGHKTKKKLKAREISRE